MDQPPSKEPRGPVSLRIKFRSATLDQFIERYAVDVSRGGIFSRTREPLPVGTQLRFDFQLQDTAPLLAGEGTIVWIRENDPTRAGVTPGMGVRFDKLTPASQPVLEKILADKARREQTLAAAKPGPAGGMAVRQPSSTFSTLDPASARAAQAVSGPPRVGGLSPLGAQPRVPAPAPGSGPLGAQPRSRAPGTGSGPLGAQPRGAAPNASSGPVATGVARTTEPAIDADPFGVGRGNALTTSTSRTAETAIPGAVPPLESTGPFGRPRSTTGMNAQRPAPAPSALFEKPTADDIDRALSVLTEMEGPAPVPAPVPVDFSSRIRRPTDAAPVVVESAPDVGDVPRATHRRPTDAHPVVLESAADMGDAPPRRTDTRPMFTGTGEMKAPTIPVVPLGDASLEGALRDEEEEDGATSAWVGSGPTRVGGAGTDPEMPVVSEADAAASSAAGKKIDLPKISAPTPLPRGVPKAPSAPAEPPELMAASFAPAEPAKTKSGSGATVAVVGLLLLAAAAGGGYYVLKGPGRSSSPAAPVPTASTEATKPAAAPEAAPSATGAAAPTPSAAAAPEQPLAVEKPAGGGTATPSSLRARPEGEPPNAAAPGAAKPAEGAPAAEAKLAESKLGEDKPENKPARGGRKGKRRSAAAEAAPPAEAAPAAVADLSPPAPAAEAPVQPAAEVQAKAASSDHVLKISSTPAGAEVIVDGNSVGTTPFSAGDVDPALPHSVTIKKEGFEAYEHMIGGSDWPRPKNGVRTLKLNAKLRSTGGGEAPKPAASEAPAEPPPGLGTTPASPKRE
ncbi:MAG TPA: TIGR02266 family protein [Polyangia bacterium]|nr:TIGR02266 family protein [Polyangia bacterium]